jgi:acetyl coenzyme A synthetase (ADP forming)-like protein
MPVAEAITLRDGGSLWVRSTTRDDLDALNTLFETAPPEDVRLRFFAPVHAARGPLVEQMLQTAEGDGMTLIALEETETGENIVAVAGYSRVPGADVADVAFFVASASQGQGIGTALLERLTAEARRNGIRHMRADVLPENARMIDVLQQSGFPLAQRQDRDALHFLWPTASAAALEREDSRARQATVASLGPLFRPRSIAVVGASRDAHAVGGAVFRSLLQGGFNGPVYPVNPGAAAVASVRAYHAVTDIPDPVDLAVIAVTGERVASVVADCARKGVRALVVLSAGFGETGAEGQARQRDLLQFVRSHNMRMVGPNCIGMINTDTDVRMNATFGGTMPAPGRLATATQSGALGLALIDAAARRGLGISSSVAVGNRADVSSNDLLEYWADDPNTDVIALYIESFGNPRKFARVAQHVGRNKPIVALKSGRSASGNRAARSHTAALAGSARAADALLRQTGVVRVDSLEDLLAAAEALSVQQRPAGRRVAIVTNAGGPGILCADACEQSNLDVPELDDATKRSLAALLPSTASVRNPVDMIASATPAQYRQVLETVLSDPQIDAVIAIYIPTGLVSDAEIAQAIQSAGAAATKPLFACLMTAQRLIATRPVAEQHLPVFQYPEAAAHALARLTDYADWLRRPTGRFPLLPNLDADAVHNIIDRAISAGGDGWLTATDASGLLQAAGIGFVRSEVVDSVADAVACAQRIGFPVAVKAHGAGIVHKSDIGGVALNLGSADAVRGACSAMLDHVHPRPSGFIVQEMVEGGRELLVGAVDDGDFGALIAFGLGGIEAEVLGDVSFGIAPLSDADAARIVRSIRTLPLLQGYRGSAAVDLAALEETLLRLSWLVEEAPEIAELDINPLVARSVGAPPLALDARVRVRGR